MAKVQTRRSISFNRDLFALAQQAAAERGQSASQFVAELVRRELDAAGKALPEQHFAGRPRAEVQRG